MLIATAVLDAWALLSPVTCAGCGADDRTLCGGCLLAITPRPREVALAEWLSVTTALQYEGVVRQAILAMKEQGRTDVARPLAAALSAAIASAVRGEVELATIPPSRSAYRRRGYDPVLLLIERARLSKPERVLERVRRTDRQKSLDREARARNLSGSLSARSPLHGRRFLLVDDVVTTGATMIEAARAIRDGGGEVVSAAALAFTPRRLPIATSGVAIDFAVNGSRLASRW